MPPVLALAGALAWLLPPRAIETPPPTWPADGVVVRGAYHVHSIHSDGTGTREAIALAARTAGLQFLVFTDHGDGTRSPDPPAYVQGVLCIDGVEINTAGGHLVALALPGAPYPLAGAADAVIEDIARLGGFSIAAHPGSPRASLRWSADEADVDGLEWLNADSDWRDESWGSLAAALLTYPLRSTETLAATLDRPSPVIARWDALARRRHVTGLAGADAHARLGLRQQTDPYQERFHLPVPSYAASFRTFSTRVLLDAPLSGDAASDAASLMNEIRLGRLFTVIDGLAAPGGFEFTATSAARKAYMGEYLDPDGDVVIHTRAAAPFGTNLVVLRDGAPVFERHDQEIHVGVGATAGVYRVEARLPGVAMPWIVSNPIYVGLRARHTEAADRPAAAPATARAPVATDQWQAEASAGSASALRVGTLGDGTPAVHWEYTLAPGPASAQYAAMHFPTDEQLARYDRVQLRVAADRPMRLWVQLRASRRGRGARWGRSFYVDETLRSVELFFRAFAPIGAAVGGAVPLDAVDALLIVADTVNTRPGSQGRLAIADLWLAR